MTPLLNCNLPRDSMSQLTPTALSNTSGAIHFVCSRSGNSRARLGDFLFRLGLGILRQRCVSAMEPITFVLDASPLVPQPRHSLPLGLPAEQSAKAFR